MALAASYERFVNLHASSAEECAHFSAHLLQGVYEAPADDARSAAVHEVLPRAAQMEGHDELRKARTMVLEDVVSERDGWRVDELDKLYTDLCKEVNAIPADVPERDALERPRPAIPDALFALGPAHR